MLALVRSLGTPTAAAREASTLAVSLATAEVFYKFHSFTLECLAFLVTWAALSGSVDLAGRLVARARGADVKGV